MAFKRFKIKHKRSVKVWRGPMNAYNHRVKLYL